MAKTILGLICLPFLVTCIAAAAAQQAQLDTTTFVVVGEGLAAGMANFGLNQAIQENSFPALIARQMNTAFPQPVIQGPGFANPIGFPPLPVRMPTYPATTVRLFYDDKPQLFVFNMSVPGMTLANSLGQRPSLPLIQKDDMQQTVVNMILGFPALILNKDVPFWTQVEYAEAMNPTLALVELGYYEVLQAAVAGDPNQIPDPGQFGAAYSTVLKRLRALNAEVVATTIPDPIDTAYFETPEAAAELMRTPLFVILVGYQIHPDDFITRNGLSEIGNQFMRGKIEREKISPGAVLRASVAAEFRQRVQALNSAIQSAAKDSGAVLYDMHSLFNKVRTAGIDVGSRKITGDYLGGFYSLDGIYPGTTGHALIANEILSLLNQTYGQSFSAVDLASIVQQDAAIAYKPATGKKYSPEDFGLIDPQRGVTP